MSRQPFARVFGTASSFTFSGRSSGRRARGLLTGVTLSLLLLASPAHAQQPISDQAKLYFSNGVELLQSSPPNYQDAYYQFKLAYEESKSWKVLGNLGLCALKLERDGEAFQYYTEYLQQGGNDIDPGERAALEREMLLISGNSAPVALTASVEGADLVVSRGGSSAPPQTYKFDGTDLSLRLRAGTHKLTATAPDGRRRTWETAISPGREVAHHFDFDAPEDDARPAGGDRDRTRQPEVRETGGELRTVGFVVTGVGAAALIGGVVTGIMAKNKEEEATRDCKPQFDPMTMMTVQFCDPEDEPILESADQLARTTNYLLIGGGVLAAAGVTLIIFGGPVHTTSAQVAPPKRALRLQPVLGPRTAGLFATGTF